MHSLAELRTKWALKRAEHARLGSVVSAERLLDDVLADLDELGTDAPTTAATTETRASGWQERLWTAPADTRMAVADVVEALGRPKSWCYRHTSPASGLPRLPHRKLDGELVFLAGEVREWVREHEDVVVRAARITPITRTRGASSERAS